MSTLFIIGNGFDKAHGLKTSYWDFRNYLEKHAEEFLVQMENMYSIAPFERLDKRFKKNKGDRDELRLIIEEEIFSDRKLMDEEFEVLLKYLADKCEKYKINVYHLDDWIKSEWCSKILSILNSKKLFEIGYTEFYNFRKAYAIIQRTMPECSRDKFTQVKTNCYLSLVFDEKYIITGVPQDKVIIDSNTHIHQVEFYLQVM